MLYSRGGARRQGAGVSCTISERKAGISERECGQQADRLAG